MPFYFQSSPIAKVSVKKITKNSKTLYIYTEKNVPIEDNTIVEFSYDEKQPIEELRWIPYRLRLDKTKDYLEDISRGKYSGERGPNGWRTALKNLEIIKNPVTKEMIFGEEPIPEKPEKYYNISGKNEEPNLYLFNNVMIKSYLYNKYLKERVKCFLFPYLAMTVCHCVSYHIISFGTTFLMTHLFIKVLLLPSVDLDPM